MNKEKYFLDLSKCSGEQIENIYNTAKKTGFIKPDFYTDKDFMMLKFCTIEERWGCSGKNWDGLKYKSELTYPEFIKLFEDGEGETQVSFSMDEMIAFGKKCFYKGFDKCDTGDANCYTAWREEAVSLIEQIK